MFVRMEEQVRRMIHAASWVHVNTTPQSTMISNSLPRPKNQLNPFGAACVSTLRTDWLKAFGAKDACTDMTNTLSKPETTINAPTEVPAHRSKVVLAWCAEH